jgi:YegS/Rv2252/BmrU family lipid kinase
MLRKEGPTISRYQHAAIIYNPLAGRLKNDHARQVDRAAEALKGFAAEVELLATQGPKTGGRLASEAIANGADLIIAAGGDGTISEIIDGVAHSQVPLGVLPAGTANVFAHEVKLKRSIVGAAKQMRTCVPERVSVGQIRTADGENHYFLLMAGAGFDAQIIYELSGGLKDKLGKLSYFLSGLARMGSDLNELEVSSKGFHRKCTFALVSKVRNYGGDFEIASEVMLRDNDFEVVLFEGKNSWRYLRYLLGVATKNLGRTPGVTSFRTDSVELRKAEDSDVYLQADGEMVGPLPAAIRVIPNALTLLLPQGGAASSN